MNEAEFQQAVIDIAKLRGWRVAHFRPARTAKGWRTPVQGHAGFPDLVLARRGRVLFIELKSDKGRITADQLAWAKELGEAFRVWRPAYITVIPEALK